MERLKDPDKMESIILVKGWFRFVGRKEQ